MKTRVLKYIISLVTVICFLTNCAKTFAATPTVTITSANLAANGITASPVLNGQTNVVVLGFTIAVTGTQNFTQFVLGAAANAYFTNGKLYRAAAGTTTYSGSTLIATLASPSTYISFSGLNETITNTSNTYFFVADISTPGYQTLPTTIQFSMSQAIGSLPFYTAYTGSVSGTNYSITAPAPPTVNFAVNTTGVTTQTSLIFGQTNIVMYGVTITTSGTATVTDAIINFNTSNSNPLGYFPASGLQLWLSTSGSFATAVQVTGVTFDQNSAIRAHLNSTLTLNTGTSYTYYLVGSFTGTSSIPTTFPISVNGILSNNGGSSYSGSVATTTYSLINGTASFANNNFTASGITAASIAYGQTGIVLFSFGLTVQGSTTITSMYVPSTIDMGQYFTNGKLYRSTDQYFSNAVLVSGATLTFNAGVSAVQITGLSQTFTSGASTTYYYFVVADLTASTSFTTPATVTYSLSSGQSTAAVTTNNGTFNTTSTITGQAFNIVSTYNWVGSSSTSFTDANNYRTLNGGTAGGAPGTNDVVQIGVVAYQYPFNQPTVSANATIKGFIFGTNNSPQITINTGITLTVSNGITLQTGAAPIITSTGTGKLSLSSGTTLTIPSGTTLALTGSAKLTNAGTINQAGTLTVAGASTNSGTINQTGTGALTLAAITNTGTISQTSTGTIATAAVTNNSGGIITLGDGGGTFNNALNNNSGGVITFGSGSTTITGAFDNAGTFTGGSGTYNFNGGATFTNSGTLTLSGGTTNIAATTFNNSATGVFTATGGTVNFNKANVQSINNDNTTTSVTFNNLTLSNTAGSTKIKTLSGAGSFAVLGTGILTLSGKTTLDAGAALLTLKSNANSSASVATLPSTTQITGTVNVERYISGGASSFRCYRIMSSPVNTSGTVPASSTGTFNFTSLQQNLIITGTGGSVNGFDQPSGYTVNGTTVLFYDEKYKSTDHKDFASLSKIVPTTLPTIGTGFYFYFRGDRTNMLSKLVRTGGAYGIPENATGLWTGTLNQGSVTVRGYGVSTDNLSYTNTGDSSTDGFNMVGNPYASTIDWNSAGIVKSANVANTMWVWDANTNSLSSFTTNVTPSNPNVSQYIASGQGFFVQASSASPTLTFTEAAKVTSQPAKLLMSIPATSQAAFIRLKMVKDSSNANYSVIQFRDDYNSNYKINEDARSLTGNGQLVSLASLTADKYVVDANGMPLNAKRTSVYLSVNATADGTYQLQKISIAGIPSVYGIWLMDHYTKDSLDIRQNSNYAFNIDLKNAATFGTSRFEIVITKKALPPYQLTAFTGKKASSNVELKWTTINEYNYTTFTVERSDDGGKNFTGIGTIQSDSTGNYSFTDKYTTSGNSSIYRLKQDDINGVITYSKLVTITTSISDKLTFSVYPNPTTDIVRFNVNQTDLPSSVVSRIYNTSGSLIQTKVFNDSKGQNDVASLLPGTYIIEVLDNGNKRSLGRTAFVKL